MLKAVVRFNKVRFIKYCTNLLIVIFPASICSSFQFQNRLLHHSCCYIDPMLANVNNFTRGRL